MNKYLVLIALLVTTIAGANAANKIGVVDIQYVLTRAPQYVAINEKLKGEFKERSEELRSLAEKGQSIQENAQKNEATMSEQERQQISRQLQELQAQITFKEKTFKEDYNRRSQEERRTLFGLVSQQVEAVAKEGQYDLILNREALLYVSDASNISDKVLAKLNALGN
ncbi:MAG: OmpH family outer membrane protein [Gammaproteobacteria bacterium]|nr:OmpH family outer membrane protein [Gammaproteobacteria bacterium]NVK87863.1 OmpH family outer membrane protein [Gammaproteobacteria bacterium]